MPVITVEVCDRCMDEGGECHERTCAFFGARPALAPELGRALRLSSEKLKVDRYVLLDLDDFEADG